LGKKKSLVDQFLLLGFGTPGSDLKKSYSITLQGEETLGQPEGRIAGAAAEIGRRAKPTLENPSCGSTNPLGFRRSRSFFETGSATISSSNIRNIARNVPDSRLGIQAPLAAWKPRE